MAHLRLLPLFIAVAFLAFAVRVVDVYSGFSNLSGAALAKAESHDAPALKTDDHAKDKKAEDTAHGEEMHEDAKTAHDGEAVEWRDAGDTSINYSEARMELFEDLAQRRKDLVEREKTVRTREALLKAAEQEIDRKYQELVQLRQEIENLLDTQSAEEEARIQSLVKIYEGMKAKQAAQIFNTLDLDVLVAVLSRMSERKLSPVLAAMNPERARTVTIMLAEQKKLPSIPGVR